MRTPPTKLARCEKCATKLNYEIGSLIWQNRDNDLCIECESKSFVDSILENLDEVIRARGEKR